MVDRKSEYPFVNNLRQTDSQTIIDRLTKWFRMFGFPEYLRSDFGPQYRRKFELFCQNNGIRHEISSAYNARANGLSEAGVKR